MNLYHFTPRLKRVPRGRLLSATFGAVLLCGALVSASPAHAYSTSGCSWGGPTITWLDNTTGAYKTPARNAATSWATRTDVNGMNPTGGSIEARQANAGNTGWEGLANSFCVAGAFWWATVNGNTYYMDSYPSLEKQAVFAHEFGHALGLNHTTVERALMNPSASHVYLAYGIYVPQSDDINGMNHVY